MHDGTSACFTSYVGVSVSDQSLRQPPAYNHNTHFGSIWPQTFSHTNLTSFSLFSFDSAGLEKELYLQWFCSSRTHLTPHWNPIITKIEQNELLLICSAASWFRVAEDLPSLRHSCTFLFLSYCHSPHCVQFCLTAPTTPTYTHIHCDFRNGHY